MSDPAGSAPSYPYVTRLDIEFGPLERPDPVPGERRGGAPGRGAGRVPLAQA